MKELLAKYRLVIVTALLGLAGVVRVVRPDLALPADEDISSWVDAALAAAAPALWLYTYYKTDTSKNSFAENTKEIK